MSDQDLYELSSEIDNIDPDLDPLDLLTDEEWDEWAGETEQVDLDPDEWERWAA